MDEDKTTNTTESTTETTTEVPEENQDQNTEDQSTQETVTTTITANASTAPVAEKQGEVAVNKDATAGVVGDTPQQNSDERLDAAKADGLRNHAAHVAEQPATNTRQAETPSE